MKCLHANNTVSLLDWMFAGFMHFMHLWVSKLIQSSTEIAVNTVYFVNCLSAFRCKCYVKVQQICYNYVFLQSVVRLFNMEVQMEKSHVTQTTAESEGEEKNKPSREVTEGSTLPYNESVVLGQTCTCLAPSQTAPCCTLNASIS